MVFTTTRFATIVLVSLLAWLVRRIVNRVQLGWLKSLMESITSVLMVGSGALLLLLACLQVGCSKTLITSRAPNRSSTVRVEEYCTLPDCLVAVTVQQGWWPEKPIASRGDCMINFAHVAW